jgi:non-specific serine/threonine protein kinase/serine/threonine-protein kinase
MVTLCAQNTLVGVHVARDEPARAEPLAIRVVEGMRRYFGPQHPFTLKAIQRRIRVYQLEGRHAEALPLLTESLATARKVHDDDHPVVSANLHLLGRSLLAEGEYAEAERHLRDCLRGLQKERSGRLTRAASPAFVQGLLGECLIGQREYPEAEPLLLASYECLSASPDAGDPEAIPAGERLGIVALERIVRLYDAWGRPGQAEAWRKELAARTGSADDGRHFRLGLRGSVPGR